MATFVSLATCPPVASPRRGLIYTDSLYSLSRKLGRPGAPQWPLSPRLQGLGPPSRLPCRLPSRLPCRLPCRLTRPELPESFAAPVSSGSSGMRNLLLTHLKKRLALSPAPQRTKLRLPG